MYKQVIVVRKDLKIGKGKLASQVAHASLGSFKLASRYVGKRWEEGGGTKVVLEIANLRGLKGLYTKLKRKKIPCYLVRDAGQTQIRPGTITTLGIGPAKEDEIDKITGRLKLL